MSEVTTDGTLFNGVIADIAETNPRTDIALAEEERVSFLPMQNTSESGNIITLQERAFREVSKGYTRFAENDVLVAKITPCFENGKGGYAEGLLHGVGFGSTEFHIIRAIPGRADSRFLHHLTRSERFRRSGEGSMTGSAGQKRIPADFIKEFPIFVPPLPEQKKIAEILSGIDRELYTCHENLSRTNLLRTSLLKSMMQGAEEDSTERALGSIVEVINGRAYKLTEWESEGTPVIRLQNLTKQGGNFYYSNLQLPEKQYCEKGDLLFMWSASFGPHIWWGERAIYHYHIWKMVPKDNALLKDYLYLVLQHKTEEWKIQGAGMAMIHLTKEGIEKEIIPLPPVSTQDRIVSAIKSVDARIEAEKSKANRISLLKTAISSDLLTGRKRVSV
jgi:type I restriction enzyme S subunit